MIIMKAMFWYGVLTGCVLFAAYPVWLISRAGWNSFLRGMFKE